jgi:hypothetical protein
MTVVNGSNENDDGRRKAQAQKERLLSGGKGYTPTPHWIYRDWLPELKEKYDGQTARDCVILLGYMHAYANGQSGGDVYMWAFPNVVQVAQDTGIHKDRIKGLVDILVSEGVMVTQRKKWYGHTKKMYLPLFERPQS